MQVESYGAGLDPANPWFLRIKCTVCKSMLKVFEGDVTKSGDTYSIECTVCTAEKVLDTNSIPQVIRDRIVEE